VTRPAHLVVVAGTATEVGKTWVAAALARRARAEGHRVAARKPAQSFAAAAAAGPDAPCEPTDAEVLAAATGEAPTDVCPAHRWYSRAMAPPMAADALGAPPIMLDALLGELVWPAATTFGLVETAGGVRSPIAHDGDNAELAHRLAPDLALLVADAGLGTINAVRLAVSALAPLPVVVVLNRFDPREDLHRRNRAWLEDHDGLTLVVDTAAIALPRVPSSGN
jgi:dethiobiotin synthetase